MKQNPKCSNYKHRLIVGRSLVIRVRPKSILPNTKNVFCHYKSQFKSRILLFGYLFLCGSNIATDFYRDFKVRSYSTETLLSNSGCGDKIFRKPCFCRVFLNSESCKSSCRENSHLYLGHVLQSIANTSNTVT